jgi:DNA-binding HxlR family transcriptional regulator
MKQQKKFFSRKSPPHQSARMVEAIYGCKWSLTVYQLLAHGINRPGEMVRSVEGLTTKVLNGCLRKNLEFGILEKQVFNELPPRVEYFVTPFGERFMGILQQLESLQQELESDVADRALPNGEASSRIERAER